MKHPSGRGALSEQHETAVCIALIVLYVVSNSLCMQYFGSTDIRLTLVNLLLSLLLLILTVYPGKGAFYGLKAPTHTREHLYFLPLLLLASVNLWGGISRGQHTPPEILFYMLSMLCVGFLEELIFRGHLFRMMEKTNPKSAVLVSALTFGVGHIVNLLNGADLLPTLLQICYATAVGYLFVVIFQKSGSLIPCIAAHACTNATSILRVEVPVLTYITPLFLTFGSVAYAIYIQKKKP